MFILVVLLLLWAWPGQAQFPSPIPPPPLPGPSANCVSTALAQGTSDYITIPELPCTPTTTVLVLTPILANVTVAPTLKTPTDIPRIIVRFDGSALKAGDLIPGGRQLLVSNGTNWFLINPKSYLN